MQQRRILEGPGTGAQRHEVSPHGCLSSISVAPARLPSADRLSPQGEKGDHQKSQLHSHLSHPRERS